MHPVEQTDKAALLGRLLSAGERDATLVFTRTKHGADRLSRQLEREGIRTAALHGNKSQSARTRAWTISSRAGFGCWSPPILPLADWTSSSCHGGELRAAVCRDVHRIGRTGRAGRAGLAIRWSARTRCRVCTLSSGCWAANCRRRWSKDSEPSPQNGHGHRSRSLRPARATTTPTAPLEHRPENGRPLTGPPARKRRRTMRPGGEINSPSDPEGRNYRRPCMKTVFIGNLPSDTTDQEVTDLFTAYGRFTDFG